jgi:hypothetical protein
VDFSAEAVAWSTSAAVMQVWAVAEIAHSEINSTGIHFAIFIE